jgi:hypothetical protein
VNTYSSMVAPERPAAAGHALLLGFWMRSAIVGGAVAAAGLASMIDPPHGVSFLMALTGVVAGAAFAWLAWRRTAALLDQVDADAPKLPLRKGAPSLRPVARVPVSS